VVSYVEGKQITSLWKESAQENVSSKKHEVSGLFMIFYVEELHGLYMLPRKVWMVK
jgi:hypothetical protein